MFSLYPCGICVTIKTMRLYLHDIRVTNEGRSTAFPDKSVVEIFAADLSGDPVFVQVQQFHPWFYLELPHGSDASAFKATCKSQGGFRM